MFYGSGAGKLPTASAVIADIMEAVENADHNVPLGWTSERLTIADQKTSVHRYFVRVEGSGGRTGAESSRILRRSRGSKAGQPDR